jgi:hypothetical protein
MMASLAFTAYLKVRSSGGTSFKKMQIAKDPFAAWRPKLPSWDSLRKAKAPKLDGRMSGSGAFICQVRTIHKLRWKDMLWSGYCAQPVAEKRK